MTTLFSRKRTSSLALAIALATGAAVTKVRRLIDGGRFAIFICEVLFRGFQKNPWGGSPAGSLVWGLCLLRGEPGPQCVHNLLRKRAVILRGAHLQVSLQRRKT